ncbi:MAG: NAD(P)-binding protein [Desulfobacterales bacterium]|jgi:hypothetical protein
MYRYLFSPIRINTLEIKNRIAYPSLGLLYSTDGKLNDRYYNYFAERAGGGAGLVTVGPVGVDYVGSGAIALSLTHDEAIDDFRKLTDIIKEGGARAWIQLFHAGAYSHPMFIDGRQPMAPSAVYSRYSRTTPREMSRADIQQTQENFARAAFAFLSLNIKKAVSVPVIASNRISNPDSAEKIIRDGYADMVNLGRVLIADPRWPQKAFEGKAEEIRPCIGCSQGCTDQVFSGRPVFCVGNARAGFEAERRLSKTDHPKKVMVVGAGASGLEAAVTAASCGHQVDVFEKDPDIGGQLWVAGAPPHKQEIMEFIRYYRAQIKKHQIPLHLNTPVDASFVRRQNPDYVILASGAQSVSRLSAGIKKLGIPFATVGDGLRLGKLNDAIHGGFLAALNI